jgi:hypothetical protein
MASLTRQTKMRLTSNDVMAKVSRECLQRMRSKFWGSAALNGEDGGLRMKAVISYFI